MNIVYSGGRYQIYGDSLKTFDKIPIYTYSVIFSDMTGFSLVERDDLCVKEEKIYGDRYKKVLKTFNSFELTDRNLGVILSGKKGVGKTLFAKMIAMESIKRGYPVIMVNNAFDGIEDFLSSIKQNVTVIFDEFDKSFCSKINDSDYEPGGPQEKLLGLFDGVDNGKKLFVITLNEYDRLSTYFKDRPGRFQYHFNIGNPDEAEAREYLEDKLLPEYHGLIDTISNLSYIRSMNYDCLRAICFDVNQGTDLKEVFEDINISAEEWISFDVKYVCDYGDFYGNIRMPPYGRRRHVVIVKKKTAGKYGESVRINVSFFTSSLTRHEDVLTVPIKDIGISSITITTNGKNLVFTKGDTQVVKSLNEHEKCLYDDVINNIKVKRLELLPVIEHDDIYRLSEIFDGGGHIDADEISDADVWNCDEFEQEF